MFDLGLQDKVAMITGGSDGLGLATARRLSEEGCKVAICARREEHLREAADRISAATGGQILAHRADVSIPTDVESFVAATSERFGGIDVVINNAGKSAAASFEAVPDEDWQSDFDLKVMGAVRLCRLTIPILRGRGGGAILNATIVGAKAPPGAALPTTLSRAAGINLTKALANEYAGDNIRVNTICIGLLKSAQWDRRAGNRNIDEFYAELAPRVPLRRIGEAEEFADLAAFLVSARAAYITGVAVNLDGGMCAVV
ncbi:MAG: SDR family oxidoreductase [Alphaproteobacteria bacterium]|jgi:NAD(P)-dependent dehydrogenase (short-subunit alcohol dehydrogenase family)|nr:SDR family oxidoreductase [Alphaproteobacteria bacterium]MDP6238232.1 SDR family oxidoreductase [Alphaproteobacteria bacterium]MDP7174193.1 SDR family oxidoreductase [Alphaproteobacteria bacterium]MDP7233012.1 SDR family oxidoreductase [Alphaproteobacteria bacterium]HJN20846.1 SDR family oxidoreductase [Alphaproteobacteria bacterium]|tara:strand:+ start:3154 stop:3927 length:774 start_codon:yes stop_codon:yes gene_type:complete